MAEPQYQVGSWLWPWRVFRTRQGSTVCGQAIQNNPTASIAFNQAPWWSPGLRAGILRFALRRAWTTSPYLPPSRTPFLRAAWRPTCTRSRITARSNSARSARPSTVSTSCLRDRASRQHPGQHRQAITPKLADPSAVSLWGWKPGSGKSWSQ